MKKTLQSLLATAVLGTVVAGVGCATPAAPRTDSRDTVMYETIQKAIIEATAPRPAVAPEKAPAQLAAIQPYATIGHAVLAMERGLGAHEGDVATLESILAEARKHIRLQASYTREQAAATLKTIDALLKSAGYTYKSEDLLSAGLRTRTIDCDLYSTLYLSIAETLNLPLKTVGMPRHMFVRWKFDDGSYLNWEATSGFEAKDDYYITKMMPEIRAQNEREGITHLRKDEWKLDEHTTAKLAHSRARYVLSISFSILPAPGVERTSDNSARIVPGAVYTGRATPIYEACAGYLTARLAECPGDPELLAARGDAFHEARRYQEALDDYSAVLAHMPHNLDILEKRGNLYYKMAPTVGSFDDEIRLMKLGKQDLERVRMLLQQDAR